MAGPSGESHRVAGVSTGTNQRPSAAALGGNVERVVNELILKAHRAGASDVHLEPTTDHVVVRARIDGVLQPIDKVPGDQMKQVIARLKIMSSLDPNAANVPTDGRFPFAKYEPTAKELDIRSTFVPTYFGEKGVLRLIDHSKLKLTLDELGLTPEAAKLYQQVTTRPSGLVLHVGPQGSGKTTTAYAALKNVPRPNASVVTVEETIEYVLPGITQIQLNPEQGLTYARALHGVLKQDPDVILIGEIRDAETARLAFEAAMTGRLILSTFHAQNAANAVVRLAELGFPRAQVAHALAGVVSQRLVRRLCPDCRDKVSPSTLIRSAILLPQACSAIYKPKGCRKCGNKGFRGRVGVFEVVAMSDRLREAVASGQPQQQIEAIAVQEGTVPLLRDAVEKVISGATAVEEMLRTLCGVAVDDVSAITEPGDMVNFLKTVRDLFLPPAPPQPGAAPPPAPAAPAPPRTTQQLPPAMPASTTTSYPRRPTSAGFPAAMLEEPRPPSGPYPLPSHSGSYPLPPAAVAAATSAATGRSGDDLLQKLMGSLPPEVVAQIAQKAAAASPAGATGRVNPQDLLRHLQELQRRLQPPG